MSDKEQFIEKLNEVIDSKSMLKHPFYQKWNDGALSLIELQEYAKQYYHYVKHFPRFVSSVHSNCDDMKTRDMLMENLADEEGYKTGVKNHPELWMDFCRSLGLNDSDVKNTAPIREVEDLVDGMYEITRSKEYELGLAALYAYEAQVPQVSETKIDGLKKYYNIDSKDALAFFEVHKEADVYHSKDELNAILTKCETDSDRKRVINTVDESAGLMWNFLDGIYNNYCKN